VVISVERDGRVSKKYTMAGILQRLTSICSRFAHDIAMHSADLAVMLTSVEHDGAISQKYTTAVFSKRSDGRFHAVLEACSCTVLTWLLC